MKNFGEVFLLFLGVFFMVLIFSFIYGAILMWLWNMIIVTVFGAPILSYWQAYGLCIICSILFKNSNTPAKKE
ncbi:MAG: hypothetical protein ACOYIG_11850 [Acetivibrionales bacterium]|jgi:hypothetical protein